MLKEKEARKSLPVEKSIFNGLTFRMSFGLVFFLFSVMSVNYFIAESRGREVIIQQSDRLNDEIGKTITLSLREKLAATESLTRSLAKLASVLDQAPEEFFRVIPEILNQEGMQNMVAGGGVWPEPYAFDKTKKSSAFFWARNADGKLEYLDDYNVHGGRGYHREEWYVPLQFIDSRKVYWSKSYRDPYSMEPMVTCSVPIWKNGIFRGVATVDLKLAGLSSFMQTQTRLIGGYAFALDRNNRLLSFPSTDEHRLAHFDISQYSEDAYPTIQALVEKNIALKSVQSELNRVSMQYEVNLSLQKVHEVDLLSQKIAKASDQIDVIEARKIARIMLETKSNDQFSMVAEQSKRLDILYDPLLKEASSVSVLHMPDIGWKVVIAMPARYTNAVVSEITEGMIGLLFILLAVAALIYLLFFNSVFLLPVNKLTQQIRSLVSREDFVTMLNIKGSDELAQLASWFNIRTSQLAEALSSLKSRNKELSEAREIAEQANRSKNIFLASMSHDIRTPMNAIIGLSDVLKKTSLHKDQAQYVQVINSSAQSLLSLINDIMDFSKIEANQLDLESIAFDFRQVMDDCADLIFFQASEKRLEFVYFVSPSVPRYVLADPNRLRQIILNLACNAVKFTESGRIELWIEVLSKNDQSSQLLIEVRDTGIGLSQLAQEKLFAPFIQADSSTTRKYGGTGLGLAISKHLVDLMGGSIEFRSEEGIGTTFNLKLRLKLDAQSSVSPQKVNVSHSNIFVLSQNHFQNTVIEHYLNSMACSVTLASSLQSWLDFISLPENKDCVTICTDFDLLGDLTVLKGQLEKYEHTFDILCFANQSEHHEFDTETLKNNLIIQFISHPLKLDNLEKVLSTYSQSHSQKNSDLDNKGSLAQLPLSMFKHKKILVVEDNKVNQQVLMIMLGYLGLSADLANDGLKGLDAIKSQHYDLVLMDWQMPRMDGLEATRKVRLLKDITQPIIIAVTANAMSGDIEKCLQSGMNDYLSKPIEKDKLETMLRRWFSSY
jgi:signal transduction histidine kinase/CheY-like chemotaxis protein